MHCCITKNRSIKRLIHADVIYLHYRRHAVPHIHTYIYTLNHTYSYVHGKKMSLLVTLYNVFVVMTLRPIPGTRVLMVAMVQMQCVRVSFYMGTYTVLFKDRLCTQPLYITNDDDALYISTIQHTISSVNI